MIYGIKKYLFFGSAIILFIAVWPYWHEEHETCATILKFISKSNNIKLKGIDKHNRPYVLAADKSIQLTTDEFELENLNFQFDLGNGEITILTAKQGLLDQKQQTLKVHKDVHVTHSKGYEVLTNSAIIYLKDNRIEGHEKVFGSGSLGKIWGTGFSILNKGAIIKVFGSPKLILEKK